MRKVLALLLTTAMLVIGCASVTPITTPSGNMGHQIECGELKDCYREAARVCHSGYNVHDRDGDLLAGYLIIIECKDSYRASAPSQQANASKQKLVVRNQVVRENRRAEVLVNKWNLGTPQRIDENVTLDRYTYEGTTDTFVANYTIDKCPEDGYSKSRKNEQYDKVLKYVRSSIELRSSLKEAFSTSKYMEYRYHNKAGKVVMSLIYDSTMVD